MSADEDIVNAALGGKRSLADQAKASGDYGKKKPPVTPVADPNAPAPAPVKSWVQELKEHVQSMFRRKKKAEAAPVDPNTLNNTSSRY